MVMNFVNIWESHPPQAAIAGKTYLGLDAVGGAGLSKSRSVSANEARFQDSPPGEPLVLLAIV
jgi:hypothetical protein